MAASLVAVANAPVAHGAVATAQVSLARPHPHPRPPAIGMAGAPAAIGVVARPPSPAAASVATATATYRVQTLNIKSNPKMSSTFVKADVARSISRGSDVIFLQEITPKYYKKIVDTVVAETKGKWHVSALNLEIPILYRTGGDSPWVFVEEGQQKMPGGKSRVSPARFISGVILKNKKANAQTAFVNTHMVSGAWSGPHSA